MLTARYPTPGGRQAGIDSILVGIRLGMVLGYEKPCGHNGRHAAPLQGGEPRRAHALWWAIAFHSTRPAGSSSAQTLAASCRSRHDASAGGRARARQKPSARSWAPYPVMAPGADAAERPRVWRTAAPGGTSGPAKRCWKMRSFLQTPRFRIVLKSSRAAGRVSRKAEVLHPGIGAGAGCDGQVLVTQDLNPCSALSPQVRQQYRPDAPGLQQAFGSTGEVLAGRFRPRHSSDGARRVAGLCRGGEYPLRWKQY